MNKHRRCLCLNVLHGCDNEIPDLVSNSVIMCKLTEIKFNLKKLSGLIFRAVLQDNQISLAGLCALLPFIA